MLLTGGGGREDRVTSNRATPERKSRSAGALVRTPPLLWGLLALLSLLLLSCGAGGTGPEERGGPQSSLDTLFFDGFESGKLDRWDDGVDPALHRIRTDPAFARSGDRYLEVTYPEGEDGGWLTRFFMPGYDSVYVSYSVRFEEGWAGNTKLLALYGSRTDDRWSALGRAGECPDGTDFFAAMLITRDAGDPGPLHFYTYYPEMHRQSDGETCYGNLGESIAEYGDPARLEPGSWHRVGFWVRVNDVGQRNAVQRFFVDGEPRATWKGLSVRRSRILRINAAQITASARAPKTQRLFVDDFLVATGVPRSGIR